MALVSAIGVSFAVLACFGALAGQYLDKKLGTSPWLLVLGVLTGLAASFWNTLRMILAFQRQDGPDGHENGSEERE